jgi:hypothetical protein
VNPTQLKFYTVQSNKWRPRTRGEHEANMRAYGDRDAELQAPSYPPKLSLMAYPKRCPCGRLTSDHRDDGITRVECEAGHRWMEVA